MQYAVNSSQMKLLDQTTIQEIHIPSMVLMERAAYSVAQVVMNRATKQDKILAVCGSGNNGGDGIAIARILYSLGYQAEILFIGKKEKMTQETSQQYEIAKNLGLSIRTESNFIEYTIIIDSIFGIGLCKEVQGEYYDVISQINDQRGRAYIYAVDLPSGISADTGQILGVAVLANETITFEEMKLGLLLYPGAYCSGKIEVAKIGILPMKKQEVQPKDTFLYYEPEDVKRLLPLRPEYSNKGTFGKVLVIAGSKQVTGASYLSAYAAYRMGVGLVKILTAKEAIPVLQQLLPEALFAPYDDDNFREELSQSLSWADAVIIGPGIGVSECSNQLLEEVIHTLKTKVKENTPLVIDADALNLLSDGMNKGKIGMQSRYRYLNTKLPNNCILTPHILELSRLNLLSVNKITGNFIDIASDCTYNSELIYVLKDARTIVTSQNLRYINVSGNSAMATGGSGDILSGMIAALLARGIGKEEAATLGVYVHGLAGELAKERLGADSVLARDIIEALPEVLMNYGRE